MKKILFLMGASALVLGAFEAKAAGFSDSATGRATVEVVKTVEITHDDSLDKLSFGQVYAKANNTVIISQEGALTQGDATGNFSADKFTVSGPTGANVTLTIPSGVAMNGTSGEALGKSLTATLNPSIISGGTVDLSQGDAIIKVGGSISVGVDTPLGAYEGTYTVTVNY